MGRKFNDLTGQKFGRLTVIERVEKPENLKGKGIYWLCICECGKKKIIGGRHLTSGHTTSCGCTKFNDLTGQKFGRLTVIEKVYKGKVTKAYWLCECKCGNTKIVRGSHLKDGSVISCGCYNREITAKVNGERMKGKKGSDSVNWKGGITPISKHLRKTVILTEWRKNTYIDQESKCQITGKIVHSGNSDVHHLTSFNTIVINGHILHDIGIKEVMGDYTQEEIKLLEEYVKLWHNDSTNAVLLSCEVHKLFHKIYGYGDNTPEQYIEFKERYLTGEFEEILKKEE